MTETTTAVEETANEIKPFIDEQDREIAYCSDSNLGIAASETSRVAIIAPGATAGRRREAVVCVCIALGSRQWAINDRILEDYFPNKAHQQLVFDPLTAVSVTGSYDVIARIDGGSVTGQAGVLRLGTARALNEIDTEAGRPALEKAGTLTRDARVKERKKAGLKKAHKAPQYSKR